MAKSEGVRAEGDNIDNVVRRDTAPVNPAHIDLAMTIDAVDVLVGRHIPPVLPNPDGGPALGASAFI